jgi:hypothetical protein
VGWLVQLLLVRRNMQPCKGWAVVDTTATAAYYAAAAGASEVLVLVLAVIWLQLPGGYVGELLLVTSPES